MFKTFEMISEHLKAHSHSTTKYRNIPTENTSLLHLGKKKKLEILEELFIKIKKPFLNKINVEYNSHVLKYLSHLSYQFLLLPSCKVLSFCKFQLVFPHVFI